MQACLGKPRVSCRRGNLTQIQQGVAIGRPKESSNNLLISESTAPLTTKLKGRAVHAKNCRTSSKNCNNVKFFFFFKNDSLEDNILSEKAAKKIYEAGNCELH